MALPAEGRVQGRALPLGVGGVAVWPRGGAAGGGGGGGPPPPPPAACGGQKKRGDRDEVSVLQLY